MSSLGPPIDSSHFSPVPHRELFKELPTNAQRPLQLSRILARYKTPLPGEVCRTEAQAYMPHAEHTSVMKGYDSRRTPSNQSAPKGVETEAGLRLGLLSASRKSVRHCLLF